MYEELEYIENHVIVLGYGDVGHQVIKHLTKAGVLFVVIDSDERVFQDVDFTYLVGDAASEMVLKKAGVKHASTVIMNMGDDSGIIFSILVTRKQNPNCVILARANNIQSVDKMYKAGADYVASLTIIAGQMLERIATLPHDQPLREETMMMYEGIEIEKYTVSSASAMVGKTLIELDLRNSIGLAIIGIQINNETVPEIDPAITITEGMTLAVLGNEEQIEQFRKKFVR
ncbi:MAG: NAD-binding protein [Methanosarcinales archaeon]|nr:NAD-binding protein [Methanosarcinales archaeon]